MNNEIYPSATFLPNHNKEAWHHFGIMWDPQRFFEMSNIAVSLHQGGGTSVVEAGRRWVSINMSHDDSHLDWYPIVDYIFREHPELRPPGTKILRHIRDEARKACLTYQLRYVHGQ